MEELQKTLKLAERSLLTKKLELAGYAFAVWRMPNTSTSQLIISLEEPRKVENFELKQLSTGFLVNAYGDNHPIKPYYIPADIIVEGENISVDPRIKDFQLDQLKQDLMSHSSKQSTGSSPNDAPFNDFETIVAAAVEAIKNQQFEKVVLSRYFDEKLPTEFSSWDFFQSICNRYPNAFVSLTYIPGKGLWIGASPELLLSDDGDRFRTVALAGTKRLEQNQNLGEIAWTQKEIEEQALVSRYIINCFKKIRLREFHEHGPKTIQAGTLAHLKTEFVVEYSEVTFDRLADQMLELLHPTSAVCGMPIEHTKPWIKEMEKYDREFYSGFLGPVNFDNSTNLFVNLRCMKISNGWIRFFAGAGITEDSIPEKEFEETDMKMNVLKSILK